MIITILIVTIMIFTLLIVTILLVTVMVVPLFTVTVMMVKLLTVKTKQNFSRKCEAWKDFRFDYKSESAFKVEIFHLRWVINFMNHLIFVRKAYMLNRSPIVPFLHVKKFVVGVGWVG